MTYVNVFGGQPQNPAQVNQRSVALNASVTLYWPWSNNNTTDTTAKILDVTPDTTGRVITLPSALLASTGEAIIFRNLGASSFSVVNASNGAVVTVAPSLSWFVYLSDNSTAAGTWRMVQFGAGASSADAASLAGAGLQAFSSVLNQMSDTIEISASSYAVTTATRAKFVVITSAGGAGTLTLPALSSATVGFFFRFANTGTGSWVIDPNASETIDNVTTLTIAPGESLMVCASTTGWFSVGRGRSTIFVQSSLSKSVAGAANVTLTTTEAGNIIQRYNGILTGSISVIVPTAIAIYFVSNETTGSFSLTVKTAAGTGVVVPQGQRIIMHCDGTNVVDSDTVVPSSSFTMADGSVGSPGLPFTTETSTGFWRPAAGALSTSILGVEKTRVTASGFDVKSGALMVGGADVIGLMLALN